MTRKERVRQISAESRSDRLVEQWKKQKDNEEEDYISTLIRKSEEGLKLVNNGEDKDDQTNEKAPSRKERVRMINLQTMQEELYSKTKKNNYETVPKYTPSYLKFAKAYAAVFAFVVIFAFAVYSTDIHG